MRTCSGDVAPAITEATCGREASHENASSSSVCPRVAANAFSASAIWTFLSVVNREVHDSERRLSAGTGFPGWYLPVNNPLASGK